MFYEHGLRFSCERCSACCRLAPGVVYLTKADLKKLCAHFDLTEKDFVKKYCRFVMYYDGSYVLSLEETENYDCVLWTKDGCSAYEARPVQCSTYPFWSWILANKKSWDECSKDCPGINKGKLWQKEEIESQKKLYDDIIPVKQNEL